MAALVKLGPRHLAVVGSGIAMVFLVMAITIWPTLQDLYVREIALPRVEERYGFRMGTIMAGGEEWYGFVSVRPDGAPQKGS